MPTDQNRDPPPEGQNDDEEHVADGEGAGNLVCHDEERDRQDADHEDVRDMRSLSPVELRTHEPSEQCNAQDPSPQFCGSSCCITP